MNKNSISKKIIVLSTLLLFINIGWSNENNFNIDECFNIIKEKDSNPTTYTHDIIDCYIQGYEYEDTQLNKVYKLVMASLDEKAKKSLLNEQRQWIKSRDSKSLISSDGDKYKSYSKLVEMNGLMGRLDYFSTLHELTKIRVEELTAMLNKLSTKNVKDL